METLSYCCIVAPWRVGSTSPPKIWSGCRDWWHHTYHCKGVKRCITHIKRISGECRRAVRVVWKWLGRRERQLALVFLVVEGRWGEGSQERWGLTWLELCTGAKGRRAQAFLLVAPMWGKRKRGRHGTSKLSVVNHQMWSQTLYYNSSKHYLCKPVPG